MREIDARLARVERDLAAYEELLAERDRLCRARAALTGERPESLRLSQERVVDYLREHPGSRAKEVADGLGFPLATISSHLYRGKNKVFVSRPDGWYTREAGR